jgi:hypothetical protein
MAHQESSTSVSTCSQSSSSSLPSDDDIFPNIDEQPSLLSDDYVLALGIKESLKNVEANPAQIDQEIEGNPAETGVGLEENPFEIDQELEVSNNIPVLDQRFANVGISHDSYVGGLYTLADICDRLYAEEEILDDLI